MNTLRDPCGGIVLPLLYLDLMICDRGQMDFGDDSCRGLGNCMDACSANSCTLSSRQSPELPYVNAINKHHFETLEIFVGESLCRTFDIFITELIRLILYA
jgi:ferredoxin